LPGIDTPENYITRQREPATTPKGKARIIFTPPEAESCKQNQIDARCRMLDAGQKESDFTNI
jgi:hypothetical protein